MLDRPEGGGYPDRRLSSQPEDPPLARPPRTARAWAIPRAAWRAPDGTAGRSIPRHPAPRRAATGRPASDRPHPDRLARR
jgi:hypothetical protein